MGKVEKVAAEITGRESAVRPFSNRRTYEKDYRGLLLCRACWDGLHYGQDAVTKRKFINCHRGKCECPCAAKFCENYKKPKKDTSSQTVIDVEPLEIK